MSVALNTKHLSSFISEEEYAAIYPQVEAAHNQLEAKSGPGNDFLGWMYLPRDYDKEEFARIKEAAAKIREDSDVLVVAGIGGSYLGARAVIEVTLYPVTLLVRLASRNVLSNISINSNIAMIIRKLPMQAAMIICFRLVEWDEIG